MDRIGLRLLFKEHGRAIINGSRVQVNPGTGQFERTRAKRLAAVVLAVEATGIVFMWAAVPLLWIWIGAGVFELTGSLMGDLTVAFLGIVATEIAMIVALSRLDGTWIDLRRRAGYPQAEGALSHLTVISVIFGLIAFYLWFYVLSDAFIIPFMPSH